MSRKNDTNKSEFEERVVTVNRVAKVVKVNAVSGLLQ